MAAPMNSTFGQFVAGEETPETEPAAKAPADASGPSELESLRADVANRDDTIRNLAARPAPAPAPVAAQTPVIQPLPAMPDPTTNPGEFEAWQQEKDRRAEARTTAAIAQTRDEAMKDVRARDITAEFMNSHPEYASFAPDVRTELSNAAVELGLQSLPDDATALLNLAETKMKERAKAYSDTVETKKPEPNRVEGVGAGTTAAAAAPADKGEKAPVRMLDVLKAQQEESGFF